MAIDELIEDKEKLKKKLFPRKVKLWNEFFNTLSEDRLAFSCPKDSFNNVKSKGIGNAFMRCLSFFYL